MGRLEGLCVLEVLQCGGFLCTLVPVVATVVWDREASGCSEMIRQGSFIQEKVRRVEHRVPLSDFDPLVIASPDSIGTL